MTSLRRISLWYCRVLSAALVLWALHFDEARAEAAAIPEALTSATNAELTPGVALTDPPLAKTLLEHVPGRGVRIGGADWAELRVSLYAYARYLNQQGLGASYTDAFGRSKQLDRRNDLTLQKVMIHFKGWLGSERFRYLFYVWTNNTNMGMGAQVVVAGSLVYRIADFVELGLGVQGLPTTRSTRGQWPGWLMQDHRSIADEYFRGSYTTGLFASGSLGAGLHYKSMLGNNLSTLGVNAGQLDDGFDTSSTALWWASENFGAYGSLGDFEQHEELAGTIGAAFTRSAETPESQPGTQDPENTQLRLSDGSVIFAEGALAAGARLGSARYRMLAADAELKWRGLSLQTQYFWRWVDKLEAVDGRRLHALFDHGIETQASAMLWPRSVQVFACGSVIFGQFGRPWDVGGGVNYFPFKTRLLRLNGELIFVRNSPVGYYSFPLIVGANGPVFMSNVELFF